MAFVLRIISNPFWCVKRKTAHVLALHFWHFIFILFLSTEQQLYWPATAIDNGKENIRIFKKKHTKDQSNMITK